MNRTKRTGFAMLYVLVVIALVGGAVYLLADACGTMAFETRERYLAACARNLTASGRAWARRAGAGPPGAVATARAVEVKPLAIPNATLDVTIRGAEATVRASCRQGRRLLTRRETYHLE